MNFPTFLLPLALLAACQSTPTTTESAPPTEPKPSAPAKTTVVIKTNMGTIIAEMDESNAPNTVKNFLGYVDSGFYNNTAFHRVIANFMIQGGGFALKDGILNQKQAGQPIFNESAQTTSNVRGTLSMARKGSPHSATSQFFINVVDNKQLDSPRVNGSGYAVFGRVIQGMEVVDAIRRVPTGPTYANSLDATGLISPGSLENVPATPVIIQSVRRNLKYQ